MSLPQRNMTPGIAAEHMLNTDHSTGAEQSMSSWPLCALLKGVLQIAQLESMLHYTARAQQHWKVKARKERTSPHLPDHGMLPLSIRHAVKKGLEPFLDGVGVQEVPNPAQSSTVHDRAGAKGDVG